MKIGIISDTHIPKAAGEIPQKVYDEFKNCGLILHAGDHVSPAVMEDLRKLAPVKAVHGNMDPQSIQQSLPDKEIVKVNGKKSGSHTDTALPQT